MPEVSINETRNIIRAIRNLYHYDFSNYALTQLRYRIDEVIRRFHLQRPENLITLLNGREDIMDEVLYIISGPHADFFRDPDMWLHLREEVIPELQGYFGRFSVWFPDCCDTNDLVAFWYILDELNLTASVKVTASCLSNRMIDEIRSDNIQPYSQLPEIARENFHKLYPDGSSSLFGEMTTNRSRLRRSAIRNAQFMRQDPDFEPVPEGMALIIFRNKLIHITSEYQNHVFLKIMDKLEPGGFIIVGYRETVDDYLVKNKNLIPWSQEERSYRKITK